MTELRPIPGFDGYLASTDGRILRAKLRGKPIQPTPLPTHLNPMGYLRVTVRTGPRKQSTRTVHSLVALAFIGPRPEGLEINHVDGNKLNNAATNLEYVTKKQNFEHASGLWAERGRRFLNPPTHCRNGHEYTPENTRWSKKFNSRVCRTCRREQERRRMARKRGHVSSTPGPAVAAPTPREVAGLPKCTTCGDSGKVATDVMLGPWSKPCPDCRPGDTGGER